MKLLLLPQLTVSMIHHRYSRHPGSEAMVEWCPLGNYRPAYPIDLEKAYCQYENVYPQVLG